MTHHSCCLKFNQEIHPSFRYLFDICTAELYCLQVVQEEEVATAKHGLYKMFLVVSVPSGYFTSTLPFALS